MFDFKPIIVNCVLCFTNKPQYMRKFFLFACTIIFFGKIYSQDFSNKGKEFWIAYPAHVDGTGSVMGLYLTANTNTSATIQVGGTTTLTQNITANQVTKIFLGTGAGNNATNTGVYLDVADGVQTNRAIKITAPQPIVVYAHIIRSARSGATLVLPTPVLGTEYLLPSYQSINSGGGSTSGRGVFAVVATQPNTTIEVTPSVVGLNGRAAGVPYQITLASPGDCYQFQSTALQDISGTTVKSIATGTSGCKPIAVFSATTWTAMDCNGASGGDNLYQQVFPNRSWGKQFVTAPFIYRNTTIYRVYVQDPTTIVQYTNNGVTTTLPTASLNATGKFYEIKTPNPLLINGDKPIMVTQYINSQTCNSGCTSGSTANSCMADPEMVILNPVEQTLSDVTFFSAHSNHVPSGQTNIRTHYVNIIINKNYKNTVKIDGAAPIGTFIDIPSSNYAYVQADLTASSATNPIHRVTADTSFAAIVYGYGNVESYGYNGGTNVVDLYQYVTLQNQFASVNFPATCKGTSFKYSITLPYQPLSIEWDFSGSPNLSPNTNVVNNAPVFDSSFVKDGKTLYVYKLPGNYTYTAAGNYSIKVLVNNPTTDGCSGIQEINYEVTVYDKPKADFGINSTGCLNEPISFTDSSKGNGRTINRWIWNFGDGTVDSVKNPTKTYTNYGTGTYAVKLTAITDIGCNADTTINVAVTSKPIANFTFSDTTCVNKNLIFINTSTNAFGTIDKWYWDFGNGIKDTATNGNNKTTVYNTAGNYTAGLFVQTTSGCKSVTTNKNFNIGHTPVVGFILPEVCLSDASAVFIDTTSIVGGNLSALTYNWNFNVTGVTPGPTPAFSTTKNGTTKYNKADNYQVKLKVTSPQGCTDSLTKAFTVNGSIPVANFDVLNANSLCSNQKVSIRNTSTVDFGNITKVEIFWDVVGNPTVKQVDDTPTVNKIYDHLYPNFQQPATKTFTIRFLAYSGGICVNALEKTVTVNASPKVQFVTMPGICFDASPRQILQATEIGGVSGANPAFTYSGNGVTSTGVFNPAITGVGTFPIKYVYTSDKGCKDSATQNITVWPSPVAKFGVSTPTCEKNALTFTDSSVANFGNITTWIYNFGDGNNLNRNNNTAFTKIYNTANIYTATLRVVTDSGCTSTIFTKPIKVNSLPVVDFTLPNICLPNGRGTFNSTSTIADGSEALFTYRWNFGDPNNTTTSTLKSPTHQYTALPPVGGYNVQLKVTSKDGCIDSLTKSLTTIFPQPKAGFFTIPTNGEICVGDTLFFKDTSKGLTSNVVSWRWNLGNGITATSKDTFRVYTDSGSVQVSLFIFNNQGCVSDTAIKTIIVHPYPKLEIGPDLFVLEGGYVQIKPNYYATNPSFKWTPATYLDSDTVANPKASPPTDFKYYAVLKGIGGCSVRDSVKITLLKAPEIPNAFSPNGDGINDFWEIKYLESYPEAIVEVFDRNGNIVMKTTNGYIKWDGRRNSKPLPVGTYYYIVSPGNGRKPMSGSVTIIR